HRQHLGRDDHVLGEPAVVVVAHRLLVRADGEAARLAVGAGAARDGGDHLHPLAGADHLAGDLVAHHPGRPDVVMVQLVDLRVGSARLAVAHPDLQLAGAGDRLRGVLDPDVARRVESGVLHVSSSITCRVSVASRSVRARSGSMRISASSASSGTWPSFFAAMPTQTVTWSPSQSTPAGKRTTQIASRSTSSLAAAVPCGIATPSPT